MTIDEAIKRAEEVAEAKLLIAHNFKQCKDYGDPKSTITSGAAKAEACADEHRQLAEWLKELKQLREQARWIPVVRREPTEEEKKDYFEQNGEELGFMIDSTMPHNGQEVLVSADGIVTEDVFDEDFYNFENWDIDDVEAWMPLPKPYEVKNDDEERSS